MKRVITFQEQDISNIMSLLNCISVSGIQNCKNIAIIVQILDSGMSAEIQEAEQSEKKEGEG